MAPMRGRGLSSSDKRYFVIEKQIARHFEQYS